jgi:hypothetical protein
VYGETCTGYFLFRAPVASRKRHADGTTETLLQGVLDGTGSGPRNTMTQRVMDVGTRAEFPDWQCVHLAAMLEGVQRGEWADVEIALTTAESASTFRAEEADQHPVVRIERVSAVAAGQLVARDAFTGQEVASATSVGGMASALGKRFPPPLRLCLLYASRVEAVQAREQKAAAK